MSLFKSEGANALAMWFLRTIVIFAMIFLGVAFVTLELFTMTPSVARATLVVSALISFWYGDRS